MLRYLLLLLAMVSPCIVAAQEEHLKRPRDRAQKPVPVEVASAEKLISAVKSYERILASKDYAKFYCQCVHSVLKKRIDEERFSIQIASAAVILEQFFDDVISTYESKGHLDSDFQIGKMPQPRVNGSLVIQFADRIDAEPEVRWPNGKPLRIQIAPDGSALRFYDID